MVPGAPAADAPVRGPRSEWLLDYLGNGFTLLVFGDVVPREERARLAGARIACRVVRVGIAGGDDPDAIDDAQGLLAQRYDGRPGTCVLLRPDQIVCARWRSYDGQAVRAAIAHATANA